MKHFLLSLLVCVVAKTASAQIVINSNTSLFTTGGRTLPIVGAFPVDNNRFVDLTEGSPFFQKEFAKSKVITENGTYYQDIPIKLNLLDNKVHFRDSTGKELIVGTPLHQIMFKETGTGKDIHFITGDVLPSPKKGWHQLLVNDTISLLKGYKKSLEEHKSYGSPAEFSIKTMENYIAFYKTAQYDIKKASDLIEIVPTRKSEVETFIKKNSKLPKEELLIATTAYCNTLLK